MKKLLIITQHFPPEIGAASSRINEMVNQFGNQGINMYIVTAKPSYPRTNLYTNEMVKKEDKEGNFYIYRSPSVSVPIPDKTLRLINQILFLFYALFVTTYITMKYSIRVYITTSPPFLINLVGLYLKLLLRRKWVMEVRDLWPDSLLAVEGIKEKNLLFNVLKKLELFFYQLSDRIVVVTPNTKSILIAQGVPKEKIHIITNGVPRWLSSIKKENLSSQVFNVNYIGNVGLSQNLNILIDVADKLKDNANIHFHIIGEGLAKKALVADVNKRELKNITFVEGTTKKNELMSWYRNTDLGIVSLKKSPLFESVIPSKVFEYAASKTEMLFVGSGEAAEMIKEYSLGYSMQPNAKQVAEKINGLSKKRQKNFSNNKKRKEFLETYSWENLIKRYKSVIPFEE